MVVPDHGTSRRFHLPSSTFWQGWEEDSLESLKVAFDVNKWHLIRSRDDLRVVQRFMETTLNLEAKNHVVRDVRIAYNRAIELVVDTNGTILGYGSFKALARKLVERLYLQYMLKNGVNTHMVGEFATIVDNAGAPNWAKAAQREAVHNLKATLPNNNSSQNYSSSHRGGRGRGHGKSNGRGDRRRRGGGRGGSAPKPADF